MKPDRDANADADDWV